MNESMMSGSRHPEGPLEFLRALEAFDIPFICYGVTGARSSISTMAAELLRDSAFGAVMAAQADRLAADALRTAAPRFRQGPFTLVRMAATHSGWCLAVYRARDPLADLAAVVVVRPQAATSSLRDVDQSLTAREHEVASLIAAGLTTKQVANRLGISTHTARHHVERLFEKLGVHSRAAVAVLLSARLVGARAQAS